MYTIKTPRGRIVATVDSIDTARSMIDNTNNIIEYSRAAIDKYERERGMGTHTSKATVARTWSYFFEDTHGNVLADRDDVTESEAAELYKQKALTLDGVAHAGNWHPCDI
jgi:molybdopterin/thiamine biosynthesis adenylyltransferase